MLKGNGTLSALQRQFLEAFATLPDQERFYLTGGTALGELERWPVQMPLRFDPGDPKNQFGSLASQLL